MTTKTPASGETARPVQLKWERAGVGHRLAAAAIDLVSWAVVAFLALWTGATLASLVESPPSPGTDPRTTGALLAAAAGGLLANAYLAITNGNGGSPGKRAMGLRLVVVAGDRVCKPGLARGIIRSGLQALPLTGALMVATGLHDLVAGTRILRLVAETQASQPVMQGDKMSPLEWAAHLNLPGAFFAWAIRETVKEEKQFREHDPGFWLAQPPPASKIVLVLALALHALAVPFYIAAAAI